MSVSDNDSLVRLSGEGSKQFLWFIWAYHLAIPCGVVALVSAVFFAVKIQRPFRSLGRWKIPARIAAFLVVASGVFMVLLVVAVTLGMQLTPVE